MQSVHCILRAYYQWSWLELGAYSQKSYAHATCVLCVYCQWAWLELGGVLSKEFYTYNLCTVCVLSVGLAGAGGRILRGQAGKSVPQERGGETV